MLATVVHFKYEIFQLVTLTFELHAMTHLWRVITLTFDHLTSKRMQNLTWHWQQWSQV